MTQPRHCLPNSTYLVTRRCTHGQSLLRPVPLITQIFAYCIAEAALETGVLLHAVCVMSNHWHAVVTDPDARLPQFMGRVHKHVAKAINTKLGREENLWSSKKPSAVRLETANAVIDKIRYTLCNPVTAACVAKSVSWPGLCEFRTQSSETISRPEVHFREDGPMPDSVELRFVPPPQFANLPARMYEQMVKRKISNTERNVQDLMEKQGRSYLGVRRILQQRFTEVPKNRPASTGINPKTASRSKWHRIDALQRYKRFLRDYRVAYERWRNGEPDVVFPHGTYGLRVYANVVCAPG